MEPSDILAIVVRWLHILAATIAVGGPIFAWGAFLPAAQTLPEGIRKDLLEAVRSRWAKYVHTAILLLLLSGFYNFFTAVARYDLPRPTYHILFGVKFLAALGMFFLASMLHGRSAAALAFRQNARRWAAVIIVLGLTVIGISGVMRSLPHTPKPVVGGTVERGT